MNNDDRRFSPELLDHVEGESFGAFVRRFVDHPDYVPDDEPSLVIVGKEYHKVLCAMKMMDDAELGGIVFIKEGGELPYNFEQIVERFDRSIEARFIAHDLELRDAPERPDGTPDNLTQRSRGKGKQRRDWEL